jgi:hypothetical protein
MWIAFALIEQIDAATAPEPILKQVWRRMLCVRCNANESCPDVSWIVNAKTTEKFRRCNTDIKCPSPHFEVWRELLAQPFPEKERELELCPSIRERAR